MPLPPLPLVLEFARAEQAEDPFAFRFTPQTYHLRTAGGGYAQSNFPWDEALLLDLEAVRRPGGDPVVLPRIGERLRSFVTPLGWPEVAAQIQKGSEQGRLVVLTIRSAAAELYALPWELLTLKASGQHVGELANVLLRYEWPETTTKPEQPLPREPGGRILVAWSAAGGAVPAAEHLAGVTDACRAGFYPFDPETDVLNHTSVGRLSDVLTTAKRDGRPISVLHILCHGGQVGGTFGLVLDGEPEQDSFVTVDAGKLRQVLGSHADMVRLVVVTACDSGNAGRLGNQLGSIAQALHRAGIAAVIASRYPLSVTGSIRLTQALYAGLLVGPESLERALLSARTNLAKDATHLDWACLQLYARSEDGDDTRPVIFRPYRGLLAFQPEHRRFFFGRDAELKKILSTLQASIDHKKERFLIVAGASGTGKSSLVFAGVVPKLLEANPQLMVLPMRPGSDPDQALNAALTKCPAGAPALLVVDQFEEIFTQTVAPTARESFVSRLWALASASEPDLRVLVTLRIDFIGRCGELRVNADGLRLDCVAYSEAYRVFVAQLQPEHLRAAIVEPACKVGLELQVGLVKRLLQDVGEEPGSLPLLEDVLDVLWRHRQTRTLTHVSYEELGGVIGSLQKRADAIVDLLTPADRSIAQRLMVSLVAVADDTSLDTRLRVSFADLAHSFSGTEHAGFERVLKELVAARLLVQDVEEQTSWVEVAHEALIRKWPRLRAWLDEDRTGLLMQRRVKQSAQQWVQNHRDASVLYRGAQLAQASEWRTSWESRLTELEREFLNASQTLQLQTAQQEAERLLREQEHRRDLDHMEVQREHALQSKLSLYVENGRQLLQTGRWMEALTWLNQAYQEGSTDTSLPFFLALSRQESARLQFVLRGHKAAVSDACFSPNGSCVVTISTDGTARLWNTSDGKLLFTLTHSDHVCSVAFDSKGTFVLTTSADRTACIWEVYSGQLLFTLIGHEHSVRSGVFSADGTRVLTASNDGTARVWDAATGQVHLILRGHESAIFNAKFDAKDQYIATASSDNTARLWEAATGRLLHTLHGHQIGVHGVDFNQNGTQVISISHDGTVRIWDTSSGDLLFVIDEHNKWAVADSCFSPDGHFVVTSLSNGTIKLWNTSDGKIALNIIGHHGDVESVHFSSDGSLLIGASIDGTAYLWDTHMGRVLTAMYGSMFPLKNARFSSDARKVITSCQDRTARLWDISPGQFNTLRGHSLPISIACFSSDGKLVLSASDDRTARLWSAADGRLQTTFRGHDEAVTHAGFSADSRLVVTGSYDATARVWDVESGKQVHLLTHNATVGEAIFSPSGALILTKGRDRTIQIWSVSKGDLLFTLHSSQVAFEKACFSPDSRHVLAIDCDRAKLWKTEDGQLCATFQTHTDSLKDANFSPDGTWIVTASRDHTVRIWDARTSQQLLVFEEHEKSVNSVKFSPNGMQVLTASDDGSAQIWDPRNGKIIHRLQGHNEGVRNALYSRNGIYVLTIDGEYVGRLWNAVDGQLICSLHGNSDSIMGADFSPDGSRILAHSVDSYDIEIFSIEQLLLYPLTGESRIQARADLADFVDGRLQHQVSGRKLKRI